MPHITHLPHQRKVGGFPLVIPQSIKVTNSIGHHNTPCLDQSNKMTFSKSQRFKILPYQPTDDEYRYIIISNTDCESKVGRLSPPVIAN
jgi:hypothetical protein